MKPSDALTRPMQQTPSPRASIALERGGGVHMPGPTLSSAGGTQQQVARSWQKARHDPTVHCSWWLLVVKPWTTSTHQNYLISPKTSLFLSFYIAPWSFILSLSHYFCFLLYLLPRVFTFYLSHYLSLTHAPWGVPHPPSHARATRLVREVRKKEAGAAYIERALALALRVRDETGPSSARGGGGGGGTGDASGGVSGG